MGEFEVVSIRDELYPHGFRKIAALLLVTSVTVLPSLNSWQNEPAERPRVSGMPTGRFGPRGGFLPEREEPNSGFLNALWTGIKRLTVVLVTTIGLMVYYPRRGFKRYALLCGPIDRAGCADSGGLVSTGTDDRLSRRDRSGDLGGGFTGIAVVRRACLA